MILLIHSKYLALKVIQAIAGSMGILFTIPITVIVGAYLFKIQREDSLIEKKRPLSNINKKLVFIIATNHKQHLLRVKNWFSPCVIDLELNLSTEIWNTHQLKTGSLILIAFFYFFIHFIVSST